MIKKETKCDTNKNVTKVSVIIKGVYCIEIEAHVPLWSQGQIKTNSTPSAHGHHPPSGWGTPSWFHNVETYNEKVVEYWTKKFTENLFRSKVKIIKEFGHALDIFKSR